MAAPYQPGYSQLNSGRFGFRFKPEPFVDNITPAYGMDADKNVSPPPNMNVNPNQQSQTMQFQNPGNNDNNDDNYQQAANQNRLNVAGSYGYDEVGKTNPMGLLPGGSFLTKFLYGKDSKFNFGEPGTTDTAGNIFAESPASGINRSYDPITGAPVGYKDSSDWSKSWTGLGTEEGLGGPSSSYGQLRAAGVNPIAAGLGSYEDSSHYIPREDRNYGLTPANLAGINDTGARLRYNTYLQNPDLIPNFEGAPWTDEPYDETPYNISKEQLGFDGSRMEGSGLRNYDPATAQFMDRSLIGTQDAIPGSVVWLEDSGQYGVVNENGTISTPQGTVVQTGGEWDPNKENEDGSKGGWINQKSLWSGNSRKSKEIDSDLDPNTINNKPGGINPLDEGFLPDEIINDPWNNMYGDGRGYEPNWSSSFSNNPTNIGQHPSQYIEDSWVNPTEDINSTSNINTNWSNDVYDPVGDSFDEPYDTEPSYDTHDSWGGGDTFDDGSGYEDSHNYNEPSVEESYSYDEGNWWNKGGQIPNRAGGK